MAGGEKHGPYGYRAYPDETARREHLGKATDSEYHRSFPFFGRERR